MAIGTIKKMYLKQQKNINQEVNFKRVVLLRISLHVKMVGLMK